MGEDSLSDKTLKDIKEARKQLKQVKGSGTRELREKLKAGHRKNVYDAV